MNKNNNLSVMRLLGNSRKKNIIEIKDFRKERDAESQNDIVDLTINLFINFQ